MRGDFGALCGNHVAECHDVTGADVGRDRLVFFLEERLLVTRLLLSRKS